MFSYSMASTISRHTYNPLQEANIYNILELLWASLVILYIGYRVIGPISRSNREQDSLDSNEL